MMCANIRTVNRSRARDDAASALPDAVRERLPRGSARRQESEPAEHALAVAAGQQIEKRLSDGRMPGADDDCRGIEYRPIGVLGGPERLLHLSRTRGGVRRVDEAGLDLAARDVVERLPHVLG